MLTYIVSITKITICVFMQGQKIGYIVLGTINNLISGRLKVCCGVSFLACRTSDCKKIDFEAPSAGAEPRRRQLSPASTNLLC